MILDHLFTRTLFESQTDHITQFASNAHEEWRRNFDPTGTKPRIKKNSDGTEGDINVPFADLHPDWQKENLAAAHAAHRAVKHFGRDMEKAAEYVHNEWMKRNPKADYNAAQHVPYDDLPEDEKEKDRVHVRTMMQLMGHHPEQGVAEGSLNEFQDVTGKYGHGEEESKDNYDIFISHLYDILVKNGFMKERLADVFHNNDKQVQVGVEEQSGNSNIADITIQRFIWDRAARGQQGQMRNGVVSVLVPGKSRSFTVDLSSDWEMSRAIKQVISTVKEAMTQGVAEGSEQTPDQVRQTLNAWMNKDQQFKDPTERAPFQAQVWPYIQQNIKTIFADKGADGKGSYPAAPYAAWLLVQHMDATPNNQSKFASQLEQTGLDPTDGKDGEGKLQFIKDRAAVNQWILKLNDPEKYLDKHGKPLTNPTADVRDPSKFDDAGIEYTSAADALDGAIAAGNTLLVDAVKKAQATTQPSYKQGVAEGNMPKSVIQSKQKYADMSDQEFHAAHKNKSEDDLRSMAWRHGYGKNSNHYVNRHKKGSQGMSEGINPLMKKLHQALLKEGRVKELADDLKNLNDAEFMKKYGKAKSAIRRDMKKVDEAAPAAAQSVSPAAPSQPGVAEARMSAAQRLWNAEQKQRAKSDASLRRTPSSIPKKQEPVDQDKQVATKVDESRRARRSLMARIVNSR